MTDDSGWIFPPQVNPEGYEYKHLFCEWKLTAQPGMNIWFKMEYLRVMSYYAEQELCSEYYLAVGTRFKI